MEPSSQTSLLQPTSWVKFISVGGVASLGVSAIFFQLARHQDGKVFDLSRAHTLETIASASRLDTRLPLLVAARGRVSSADPAQCKLSDTRAVMRELVEEEVYYKEHSSGRVTQECFELRREQEQREAFLEDTTASVKVDNVQHAAGLTGVMEVKQAFTPTDLSKGPLLQHVINKAFKSMVKSGCRLTERYLPVATTVTIVGELVPDRVGRNAAGRDSKPAASRSEATQQSLVAAMAAVAEAELMGHAGEAVAVAGSAAMQMLPYTLRMPSRGPFYVTPLTLPQLRTSMEVTSKTLRAFAWGFGLLGAVLVARRVVLQLWREREQRRLKRMLAEAETARRQRQAQQRAGENGAAAGPNGAASVTGDGAGAGGDGYEGDRGPGVCVVCLDRDTEVVFSGCGHMCTCASCTVSLQRCPICRVHSRPIRVFRS